MTTKPNLNAEVQRVLAGKTTTLKVDAEQAAAIHDLFEKSTRAFYNLPKILARYAATGAPVNFFQKPKAVTIEPAQENTNRPGFKK